MRESAPAKPSRYGRPARRRPRRSGRCRCRRSPFRRRSRDPMARPRCRAEHSAGRPQRGAPPPRASLERWRRMNAWSSCRRWYFGSGAGGMADRRFVRRATPTKDRPWSPTRRSGCYVIASAHLRTPTHGARVRRVASSPYSQRSPGMLSSQPTRYTVAVATPRDTHSLAPEVASARPVAPRSLSLPESERVFQAAEVWSEPRRREWLASRLAAQRAAAALLARSPHRSGAIEIVHGGQEGRGATRVIARRVAGRSEEHTSELQSRLHLVCRLLLVKKKI